jgi:hypothetical protein
MEIHRRKLLVAGGSVLFAGCSGASLNEQSDPEQNSTGDEPETDTTDGGDETTAETEPLDEAIATVLDVLPTQVGDTEITEIQLSEPSADVPLPGFAGLVGQPSQQLGVADDAIDRRATSFVSGDSFGLIAVTTGSFAPDELSLSEEEATYTEDGLLVTATKDGDPWEEAIEAAKAARSDPDTGLISEARPIVRPIQESQLVYLIRDFEEQSTLAAFPEEARTNEIQGFAYGQRFKSVQQQEHTFVAKVDQGTNAFEETRDVIAATAQQNILNLDVQPADLSYERAGQTLVGSLVGPVPAPLQPDNSPDGRFILDRTGTSSSQTGSPVLRYTGEEPVDPERLVFEVDGESRTPPWARRDDPITPGEIFELAVAPLRTVRVLWADPEYDTIEQPLGIGATGGQSVFEDEYTSEGSGELTLKYTGNRSIDASRLSVLVGNQRSRNTGKELATLVGEQLTQNERFVIEDVPSRTSVTVILTENTDGRIRARTGVYRTVTPAPSERNR